MGSYSVGQEDIEMDGDRGGGRAGVKKTDQADRGETPAVSWEFSGPWEDIRGSRRKVGGQ